MRVSLLQRAKEKFAFRNVWTTEGRILTSIDGKIMLITSKADHI